MAMVKEVTVSTNEIYQLAFLKEAILDCSSKRAMTSSFCRAPCSLRSVSSPCCFSMPPENIRKPKGFLMFSGGIEKQHQAVMS